MPMAQRKEKEKWLDKMIEWKVTSNTNTEDMVIFSERTTQRYMQVSSGQVFCEQME